MLFLSPADIQSEGWTVVHYWMPLLSPLFLRLTMSSDSKYKRGQTIREIGTGDQYTIVIKGEPDSRLWSPGGPLYWIRSHGKDTDHILWAIAQSTLEDEFEPKPPLNHER
jgi:hypothetical protein